jgi:hypothetical protein
MNLHKVTSESISMSKSNVKLSPNIVDRPSIDEVSLCYRGSVNGLVDIERWPVDYVSTHL